jgi:hypothetical protein
VPVPGIVPGQALAAHRAGRLKFFGVHARLDNIRTFKAYLARLRKIDSRSQDPTWCSRRMSYSQWLASPMPWFSGCLL